MATSSLDVYKRQHVQVVQADVIVAGGSTAALAAALAAAAEGAQTVLLEPTDWIGGQLTASGVPAVDEAWHQIKDPRTGKVLLDVSRIARDPDNMTPKFREMLEQIGNPGGGWVSRFCFPPRRILDQHLVPWEQRLAGKLSVYRETVVKHVDVDLRAGRVVAIEAIQRFPRSQLLAGGYDVLPSEDLADWYDPQDSPRFTKVVAQARYDWRGGVDLDVMAAAERRAFAWHHWFKQQAPAPWRHCQKATELRHIVARRTPVDWTLDSDRK